MASSAMAISGVALADCLPSSGIYRLSATVSGSCGSFSANTAESFIDKIKTSGLSTISGITYTGSEVASISGNFNSLPMFVSYPNAGSTGSGALLNFSIPELGVNKTFQGSDRDASQKLLKDYLKSSDIIGQVMKYQAANSPHSPIAGPGGAIPTAVANTFNENFTDTATNIVGPASASAGASSNLFGIAIQHSALKVKDNNTNVTTLPLSYTARNDIDPRRQLVFSLPISLSDTDGAKSYAVGLGVSYRFPMNDQWTLTPSLKTSVVGSKDLATVAAIASGALTSTYMWPFPKFDLVMGNMIGYHTTLKVTSGDYSANPGINSTVFRNGLMLSHPVMMGGHKLSLEYSLIDTRYTGTKFYVDNTQEVGITIGTNKRAYSARSFVRGGITYLHGKDTNGVSLNFGYWF